MWQFSMLLSVLAIQCGAEQTQGGLPKSTSGSLDTGRVYTFAWREPTEVYELPVYALEASGLSCHADRLALNIDERGVVYYFDTARASVVDSCVFRPKGDFEGIEIVGDSVYLMRSKGTLHVVPLAASTGCVEQTYTLPLPESIDLEGLGYDASTHSLILAEKGDKKMLTDRRIWSYSLTNRQLTERLSISHKDFVGYLPDILWAADKTESDPADEFRFAPSAIAVHPESGDFFILSSVSRRLLILRPDGRFHALVQLDKSLLIQPEGIAFDKSGNLWLASEGKAGKEPARLFFFSGQ
jgi:hypothetical protein